MMTKAVDLPSSYSYSGGFFMCYLFQISMGVNLFQVIPALAEEPSMIDTLLVPFMSLYIFPFCL